jgi:hypothetical protein
MREPLALLMLYACFADALLMLCSRFTDALLMHLLASVSRLLY